MKTKPVTYEVHIGPDQLEISRDGEPYATALLDKYQGRWTFSADVQFDRRTHQKLEDALNRAIENGDEDVEVTITEIADDEPS